MKNKMKRVWAMALVVMMIFSMAPSAMAVEYYSGSLSVGGRVKITPAPTNDPTPAPEAQEPEKSAEPEASAGPEESTEPEASAEPEVSVEPEVSSEPTDEATVSPEVTGEPTAETTVAPEASAEPTPEPRAAVVYKEGEDKVAIVREGPSSDSKRVGKAYSGDLVTVFAEQDDWLQVEVGGMTGWMHSGLVSFDLSVTQTPEQTEIPETEPSAEPEQTEVPEIEPTIEPEPSVEPEATVVPEQTEAPETEPTFEPRPAMVNKKGEHDVAFVREGPSIDFERVGKVTDGDPLTVLAEENGWYQVDANGLVGWMSGAMITFDLGDAQPTETPAPTETSEPTVSPEPTVGLEETEKPEETIDYMMDENGELILDENGNPIPVVTEEAETTPEPKITYERDAEGKLVLDENGNPIAIVPEGMEMPMAYLRDDAGLLVFDVYGDPIPVEPEAEEPVEEPSEEPVRLVMPLLTESETGLPMYAEANAESEVLAVIPVGQMVAVLEIGEEWSRISYDAFEGYVQTAKIALYNQEVTPEEETIVRSITVTSSLEGAGTVEEGTECVLTATLTGFEDTSYVMQWQYTPDMGETIVDVEGANGETYSFPITLDNADYLWRLSVMILDETQESVQP